MKTKFLLMEYHSKVVGFPNFHASGSIAGIKKQYYGKNALLVKCGSFIYNVTSDPSIYHNLAY